MQILQIKQMPLQDVFLLHEEEMSDSDEESAEVEDDVAINPVNHRLKQL